MYTRKSRKGWMKAVGPGRRAVAKGIKIKGKVESSAFQRLRYDEMTMKFRGKFGEKQSIMGDLKGRVLEAQPIMWDRQADVLFLSDLFKEGRLTKKEAEDITKRYVKVDVHPKIAKLKQEYWKTVVNEAHRRGTAIRRAIKSAR